MHKRGRRAKMAFQIDAMLVSPDTPTKGGGPHVSLFYLCPPLRVMVANVRDINTANLNGLIL